MCKVGSDVDAEEVRPSLHCLGNGSAVACAMSREIWFHVSRGSSFRLVSQLIYMLLLYRIWRNNLAEIIAIEFGETI